MGDKKAFDPDEIRFGADVVSIVEDELQGSVQGDEGEALVQSLWHEYQLAGKPVARKAWLKERLTPLFPSVGDRPVWVEPVPEWPYLGPHPMTFVAQVQVPAFTFPSGNKVDAGTMYLFVADQSDDTLGKDRGYWKLMTKVIVQHPD